MRAVWEEVIREESEVLRRLAAIEEAKTEAILRREADRLSALTRETELLGLALDRWEAARARLAAEQTEAERARARADLAPRLSAFQRTLEANRRLLQDNLDVIRRTFETIGLGNGGGAGSLLNARV